MLAASSLLLSSSLEAQSVPVTDVLLTPQQLYQPVVGSNPIEIYGPPGAIVHGLLSQTTVMPDSLTWIQINSSAPNDYNFVLNNTTYTMTTTLDTSGRGTLDVFIAGILGTQGFPHTITLAAELPGVSGYIVETRQLTLQALSPPLSISPLCAQYGQCGGPGSPGGSGGSGGAGGAGGRYTGPGDTVAPNLGDGPGSMPWVAGTNNCALDARSACTLTEGVDTLGCPADADVYIVPQTYYKFIGYLCLPHTEGSMGTVTFGPLEAFLNNSTKTYIDFSFSPPTQRSFEWALVRPTFALQSDCLEWLWRNQISPGQSCSSVLNPSLIVTDPTPGYSAEFGISEGFFTPSNPFTPWDRAHGQGLGCVRDTNCYDNTQLKTQRVRFSRQCLLDVMNDIKASNPGYAQPNTTVFEFGGTWCPLPTGP
ncbi:MAG: hypothetical protein ACI9EF_003194 [Pseudohongiellaceae bacterium]|jgi:hypothetical protein